MLKKLFLCIALCLPATTIADYLDVIEFRLKEGCDFNTYMEIVKDFNENWAPGTGYSSRIAMPLSSDNLESLFWVGSTENAATFGAAWDKWRDELADPETTAAQLWARFQACSENITRKGYDLY